MSISSKYLMHTSMPKMSPIPTQRWWVGCSCRSACKRFKWWSWTDMMDGKQYQYQCPRNYKRNFIALEQQDRWWSDQQILGTLHSCRRHQDAGRDESQPAIAGYEKFCEMATLPTCILRRVVGSLLFLHPSPFFACFFNLLFFRPNILLRFYFPSEKCEHAIHCCGWVVEG